MESAAALPLLKSPMARLIGRIARGEVVPRGARSQHPEDAIEDRARIAEGAPAPIGTAARSKERFEDGPLLVGQVHAVEYDSDRNAVSGGVPIYETSSRFI